MSGFSAVVNRFRFGEKACRGKASFETLDPNCGWLAYRGSQTLGGICSIVVHLALLSILIQP